MTARESLFAEAAKRILITDGAFGTEIQNYKLTEADYAGSLGLAKDQKGNNDILALTKPEVPAAIHRAYFEAGADIAETNTFSANRISQADYAAEHLVREINLESAKLARSIADEFQAKDGRPRFVAGAIGPTNKTLSLSPDVNDPGYREIDWDTLVDVYKEQAAALVVADGVALAIADGREQLAADVLVDASPEPAVRGAVVGKNEDVPHLGRQPCAEEPSQIARGRCVEARRGDRRVVEARATEVLKGFRMDR